MSAERTLAQRYESEKQTLERNIRELRAKNEELETLAQTRARATIAALESKCASLEEALNLETNEQANSARAIRRLEKKLAERSAIADEIQRTCDNYKEEVKFYRTLNFLITSSFLD